MNNQQLLQLSIESLKKIQEEMHDGMDSSKRNELGIVIKQLEQCSDKNATMNATQLLGVLGKVIAWIPAIERLLKIFSE